MEGSMEEQAGQEWCQGAWHHRRGGGCGGERQLLQAIVQLRGYTAVVPWIPRSRVDPPVFFSQSALQQPTGKSLDQTLDVATCKWPGELRKAYLVP